MSLYYESQNRNPTACDFGGNAKVNTNAQSNSASSVAESCIANPSATFVPGSPSSTSGGKPSSTSGGNNGSASLMDSFRSLGLVMGISVLGALWTLIA